MSILSLLKYTTCLAITSFFACIISACGDSSSPDYTILKNQSEVKKAIPYAFLSDENTKPFANAKPKFTVGDERSILNFPSVRDCLIDEEQKKINPDLRLLNWDKMATLNDLDVCIWRILTSYEKPERIYAWFSFHGAKPSISLEEFRTPPTTNIPVRPLYFSWKLSETKPPLSRPSFNNLFLRYFGVSVPFMLNEDKLLNVKSKWVKDK